MSDGMGREFTYLSSHATNRYFIPNWGNNFMVRWSFNSHFYDKVNFWQTIHEKPLLLRHTNQ